MTEDEREELERMRHELFPMSDDGIKRFLYLLYLEEQHDKQPPKES